MIKKIPWLLLFISSHVYAFNYFGEKIDYWNEAKPKQEITTPKTPSKDAKEKSFDWKKYSDPQHDEFFEEGNHKPPKPFMELARNPSDENIKRWFAIVDKKNKLMTRLHAHLQEYLQKNQKNLKKEKKEVILDQIAKTKPLTLDVKRFRFRLYFDSQCPHCKNMMQTARELQETGYYVEVRQIDKKRPAFAVPFPIILATPQEVKAKKINSWPVLFVADTKKELIYRIGGYHSTEEINQILSKK